MNMKKYDKMVKILHKGKPKPMSKKELEEYREYKKRMKKCNKK